MCFKASVSAILPLPECRTKSTALTGLKLKRQSPLATTFNISLANGASGYIPPPEQHELGGYTTWPARTAGLEVQAEPKMVEAVLGLLEELAGKPRRTYQEADTPYSQRVLASRPAAFWRFAEMQGPSAADSTGNGHELRYAGQVAYHLPGREGDFGNRHDTHSVHLAGGHLVADDLRTWARTTRLSFRSTSPRPLIFAETPRRYLPRGEDRLFITGTSSQTPGRLAVGGQVGRNEIQPHCWQHLVFVRSGEVVQVYLNGTAESEISLKLPRANPLPDSLSLGGDSHGTANLEGKIDEASVFGRTLSPAEISDHFRTTEARNPRRERKENTEMSTCSS